VDEWLLSLRHVANTNEQYDFLPGIVEDEILCVFSRLENDLLPWHEADRVLMHPKVEARTTSMFKAMPINGFFNLPSAQKYCYLILRQVDWFVCARDDQLWTLQSKLTIESEDLIPSDDQISRANDLRRALEHWRKAFQPIVTSSAKTGGNNYLVATALLLRFTCSHIALNCCLDSELSYDSYASEFGNAICFAKLLLNAAAYSNPNTFIVSSILVRSLYFIALKCRQKNLRQRAASYLQSIPTRREGIWDARVASTVANIIVNLEMESKSGSTNGDTRLSAIKTSFDLHLQQGKLRYLTTSSDSGYIKLIASTLEFSW
jgi:hypothetical protein